MDTLLPICSKQDLLSFEKEVADRFAAGAIRGLIHLSGGNEDQLIEMFQEISREDWVFSTWRSHYHALLHGVPRQDVMRQICEGHSMNLSFPSYRFYTSAIVAGILPIAEGVAAGLARKRERRHVWCFVGDMAACTGVACEVLRLIGELPMTVVIEDNGVSANTPTDSCWTEKATVRAYSYSRTYPHTGTGQWVKF